MPEIYRNEFDKMPRYDDSFASIYRRRDTEEFKKFEKLHDRPSDELDKFFQHKELTEEELNKIDIYRKKCIEIIREYSILYKDLPTDFARCGINVINIILMHPLVDEAIKLKQSELSPEELNEAKYNWKNKVTEFQKHYFQDKPVIELGAGNVPSSTLESVIKDVFRHGASKLILNDLDELSRTRKYLENNLDNDPNLEKYKDKIEIQDNQDMLSFLLRQKESSASIISFGALCPAESINITDESKRQIENDYFHFIIHEIHRVTPEKGYTAQMASSDNLKELFEYYFNNFSSNTEYNLVGQKKDLV